MKTVKFGSISSGTMQPRDLIPAFAYELQALAEADEHVELIAEANTWEEDDENTEDMADDILQELFDALQEAAPQYGYFGAHPGDGADYGFWLSEAALSQFDGLRVDDTSEVPADYSGEVLHVNDHGNMTLYAANKGELTEVWGVV